MTGTTTERLDDDFWVTFGRANTQTLDIVGEFFKEEDEFRSRELLEWQYLSRLGGSYVAIAHTSAGLVDGAASLYSAQPSVISWGSRTISAVQSFDSITAKRFRGRGLFSRLGKRMYEKLRENGVELVYGIPNENINNARITQLGWGSLDPLPFMVRPIGLRYLGVRAGVRKPKVVSVGKLTSNGVSEISGCPSDISALLEFSDTASRIGVLRDFSYLSWRLNRPGATYRHFESRKVDGTLAGYGACELVLKHGCATGYILEVMFDRRLPDVGNVLVETMLDHMTSRGADIVLAWSIESSDASRSLRKNGFLRLPERLRPIKLHLGYRSLKDVAPILRSDLSFSYLDSDTV